MGEEKWKILMSTLLQLLSKFCLKPAWSSEPCCWGWTGSFLDCSLWKPLILPGCQKKQHPSNSFSGWSNHQIMVTLAAICVRQWRPLTFYSRCSSNQMLTQRWCWADVWYKKDIVCRPPPMQPHTRTNALTAGGPSPKLQINQSNQREGSSAPRAPDSPRDPSGS